MLIVPRLMRPVVYVTRTHVEDSNTVETGELDTPADPSVTDENDNDFNSEDDVGNSELHIYVELRFLLELMFRCYYRVFSLYLVLFRKKKLLVPIWNNADVL